MKWKKVFCRWNNEKQAQLADLGIKSEEYEFKEIYINVDNAFSIDEYEGVICVSSSSIREDSYITNIPYTEENIKKLIG